MKANFRVFLGAVLLAGSSMVAEAGETVRLKGVHLCCGSCVKGVEKAVAKLEGCKVTADKSTGDVQIEANDLATAKKAVAAIGKAGYYGKSDRKDISIPNKASKEKVEQVTVKGLHLCCGKCVKGLQAALDKCSGVKANTAETKAETFQVSGHFSKADLVQALQEAGFNGVVE